MGVERRRGGRVEGGVVFAGGVGGGESCVVAEIKMMQRA